MFDRILTFEIDEIIDDIDQVGDRFPSIIFLLISFPFDEVLPGSASDSHVKNLLAEICIVPL